MQPNKNLTLVLITAFIITVAVLLYVLVNKFILNTGSPIGNKITLDYWGLYESEVVMNEMIKKYEAENPNVDITYTQKLGENDLYNYKKNLLSRLRNGTGPAVFRAHSTWMPSFYSELSKTNKAISPEEYQSRFYSIANSQCVTLSKQVVCIPIMYDGLALLYNVDILRNEGINPSSIQTWEDLRVAAVRLTRYSNNNEYSVRTIERSGVALGDPSNVVNTPDILGLMFLQNGLVVPDDLVSDKTKLIFEFYTDFVSKDRVWDSTMPNSLNAFASGQTVMVFAKSTQMIDILKLNPTINMGALPVPQLPVFGGDLTKNGWASFWVETVSDDLSAAEQKEAWKFLEWLSKDENQVFRFNLASKYSKFGEAYSSIKLKNNLINSPLLGPIVSTADDAKTARYADTSGNDPYIKLFTDAIKEYLETKSEAALSAVFTKLKFDYETLTQKEP
jgi:ABC-type glycerol-3-phosphate transport system substrate-binding protein